MFRKNHNMDEKWIPLNPSKLIESGDCCNTKTEPNTSDKQSGTINISTGNAESGNKCVQMIAKSPIECDLYTPVRLIEPNLEI